MHPSLYTVGKSLYLHSSALFTKSELSCSLLVVTPSTSSPAMLCCYLMLLGGHVNLGNGRRLQSFPCVLHSDKLDLFLIFPSTHFLLWKASHRTSKSVLCTGGRAWGCSCLTMRMVRSVKVGPGKGQPCRGRAKGWPGSPPSLRAWRTLTIKEMKLYGESILDLSCWQHKKCTLICK